MIETVLTDLYFHLCEKYPKEDWALVIHEYYNEWLRLCMKHLGLSFMEIAEYQSFMKIYAPTKRR